MSVLQILGILLVVLLAVVGYRVWKLYVTAKAEEKQCYDFEKALSILPELELNLQKSDLGSWINEAQIRSDEIALRDAGLIHKGYYVNRSPASNLQVSLWQFKSSLTIALCENQIDGEKLELHLRTEYSCQAIARLNTDNLICVTNSHGVKPPISAKDTHIVVTQESNPISIIRLFKSHIPKNLRLLPIVDSKAIFVRNYENQSHWLWQPKQLRSAPVVALLEKNGIALTDYLLNQLESRGQSFLSQIYCDRVLDRLSQTPDISPEQWQEIRGKCVVIHEKMNAENLSSALIKALHGLTLEQAKELESLSENTTIRDPITSFQEYLNTFNQNGSTKRIAKMQLPIRAEVYLTD